MFQLRAAPLAESVFENGIRRSMESVSTLDLSNRVSSSAGVTPRPQTARARLPNQGKTKLTRRKLRKIRQCLEERDDEGSDSEFVVDTDSGSEENSNEEDDEWIERVNEAKTAQDAMRALHEADPYTYYTKGAEIYKMVQLRFNDFKSFGFFA